MLLGRRKVGWERGVVLGVVLFNLMCFILLEECS